MLHCPRVCSSVLRNSQSCQRFSRGHLTRTRSRTRPLVEFFRGWGRDEDFFPFSSAFLRTRRGIPRNFGLFLSHFKDETFVPCFSRSRTRRGEEFCLIPRPFRGRDETLENLWLQHFIQGTLSLLYLYQTTMNWVKNLSVFCYWQVVCTLETGLYSIKYILYACRSISQTILCLIIIMYKVLHKFVWKSCTVHILIFVPCVHYALHNRWPILPKLFRPVSRLYTLKKKHHI